MSDARFYVVESLTLTWGFRTQVFVWGVQVLCLHLIIGSTTAVLGNVLLVRLLSNLYSDEICVTCRLWKAIALQNVTPSDFPVLRQRETRNEKRVCRGIELVQKDTHTGFLVTRIGRGTTVMRVLSISHRNRESTEPKFLNESDML